MATRVEKVVDKAEAVRARKAKSKGHASRGKRYSPAQKREILEYAQGHDVRSAAEKFGVTEASIYEWRRAMKRRGVGELTDDSQEALGETDPKQVRDNKVLALWRQHPGYGPSQIRNLLKREGFKISVGTVRHVMEENGYLAPTLKRKTHVGRYEAARPRELYHLDFYHFYVHKQKQCVLFMEDDFSRFIPAWAMVSAEAADPVIACFEQAVERYGRPEGVMSDRGSALSRLAGPVAF